MTMGSQFSPNVHIMPLQEVSLSDFEKHYKMRRSMRGEFYQFYPIEMFSNAFAQSTMITMLVKL